MLFDFYTIDADPGAEPRLRKLSPATVDTPSADAVAAVNARFAELIASNPRLGNLVVIAPSLGEPCGAIVASERIHSQPREGRMLIWTVTEFSA